MLERILLYLDDETKIVQYGATYNGNICFNGLCVDDPKRIVVREGKEIELTYAVNHCISLKLPWLFLIALVAVKESGNFACHTGRIAVNQRSN